MKVELLSVTPDAEKLIETAARTAYRSFAKQKIGTEKKIIRLVISKGHYSVLEHAYATFKISGVSRAFTHQLVRHRLCSFTQQSQRYVNESKFSYIEPSSIKTNPNTHTMFTKFMKESKKVYLELQRSGIKNEDARFVLPNAVESQIVVTANIREWRHIIKLRGNPDAQWEIRNAAIQILKIFKIKMPTIFEDFDIDDKKKVIRNKG